MTSSLLEVSHVTVTDRAGDKTLIDDLSFTIAPGERVGLIGASGSGKSLTALAVMKLTTLPVTGSIRLGGTELTTASEKAMNQVRGKKVAMVFQEPMTALDPLVSVGKQLREALKIHGTKASVTERLAEVGLEESQARSYPHELSGGQRQRVLIAMAVAHRPDLLICDEPTTALDTTVQAQIMALLSALTQRYGIACLFITHDLALVADLCPRTLVMRHGRILESGATKRVLEHPEEEYTRELVAAARTASGVAAPRKLLPRVSATTDTAVAVSAVSKTHRGRGRRGRSVEALREVSFDVKKGEALGIVGGSGSGKSTLLALLAGLREPDSGSVSITGGVQMVFQDPASSLDPRFSAAEVIVEANPKADVATLLSRVGIDPATANRRPHEFSGGQRQRISLARALASQPAVLLADEAVSALDVTVQATIIELLRDIVAEGRTLVFVSHDLGVIRQTCQKVIVLDHGRIVESGEVEKVWHEPRHEVTRALLQAVPRF